MPGRTRPGRRRSRWAGRLPIPRVLAIGASTGRPQALSLFLGRLSPHLDNVPVLIVLHMPPDFTDVACGHIERATGRPTHAARNSERIRPGEIYFAPGNRHLKAAKLDTTPILLHCDSAPENFCRPAVNVLFRSVVQRAALVEARASSVVWGMAGAIVRNGLASAILPIDTMASQVAALLSKRNAGIAA